MRKLILFSLMVGATLTAVAGGPTYSRYGIGDLAYFGSNRAFAIGVLGISLGGDGFINRFNPAGLSRISLTRISAGFEFSTMTLKDQVGSTKFARGDFQSLALAIPISRDNGVILFAETSPYSNVDYKVEVRELTSGSPSTQTFSGLGGLSTLSLGLSYRPQEDFSVGLKYSYVYGAIEHMTQVKFDDVTYTNNEFHTSRFHSGSVFTLGLLVEDLGSFLGMPSLKPLQAGVVITTPAKLSVRREHILLTPSSVDTTSVLRGKTDLPVSFGFGTAYQAGERLLVTGEVFLQNWEGAKFFGGSSVGTTNNTRLAAGVEFLPRRTPSSYGDRVAYRAGFAYNSSYYRINGEAIDEWYLSGGVGLPIGPDAKMNLTLQAGSRGTMDGGLQKVNFVRFSVSISASEAWFMTLEED
jgi:hypothetical protein